MNLAGACNVSAILVQSYFESRGVKSILVNNSRHSFNMIGNMVVDLTASQISMEVFNKEIEFINILEIKKKTNEIEKGKGFYDLSDNIFFIKGQLKEILIPQNNSDDIKSLIFIFKKLLITIGCYEKYELDLVMTSYNDLIEIGKRIQQEL